MKIVFMGTPEFSVPCLQSIIDKYGVEAIKAVFTQPDRPKGRGQKLAFSAVKELAIKYNIDVYQPQKLKNNVEMIEKIKEIEPDFIVVVAFAQILPKEVLDIPKYGCINVHASLLPKYRGAGPINWCVINGEKQTGITTMLMNEGLDTGDMLLKCTVDIDDDISADELHDKLMEKGGDLLVKTLEGIVSGSITPEKQDDKLSNYAPILDKKIANINWNESAVNIKNLVRGLNSWPVAYTIYKDIVIKVYKVEIMCEQCKQVPGTIVNVDKSGIMVSTNDNYILIKEIQIPGKKKLKVEEYINGHSIDKGVILN
jgi:methionyl-tRNA formyltransferase